VPKAASTDVLFLNWRDATHPEGGGSERYVHRIAEGLAAAGLRVTLLCAAHGDAPPEEIRNGVRVLRRGGRLSVYPHGLAQVLRSRPRAVVEVQNGVPFACPLVIRRPVLVLVHHVHREQWPILFGRVVGALGWWLESRVAPRVHRRSHYVAVSPSTAAELAELGVAPERTTVVPNGAEPPPPVTARRDPHPRLVVLGRLVPHKRVEHAIEVVARLRWRYPDLRLDVVGDGWWGPELRAHAERLGVTERVTFHGHVDEQTKHELLARAWLHVCASVKEGWGIVVTEAGGHAVPTVAYRSAGGVRDSVRDGAGGLLVEHLDGLVDAVDRLLANPARRAALGTGAARAAAGYSWAGSVAAFLSLLEPALGPVAGPVADPERGRDAADPASALAVVHSGRRRRRGGRILVQRSGRPEHRDHREDGPDDQCGRDSHERSHAVSRLPRARRAETVTRVTAVDNAEPSGPPASSASADPSTAAAASTYAPSTADTANGPGPDASATWGTRRRLTS
jgi:glycosyltransferase involved in cell wall biosynthesis